MIVIITVSLSLLSYHCVIIIITTASIIIIVFTIISIIIFTIIIIIIITIIIIIIISISISIIIIILREKVPRHPHQARGHPCRRHSRRLPALPVRSMRQSDVAAANERRAKDTRGGSLGYGGQKAHPRLNLNVAPKHS